MAGIGANVSLKPEGERSHRDSKEIEGNDSSPFRYNGKLDHLKL
ncbi:hypothetical protein COLO4_19440 [Corchorus olitorius]|uniref:Uncharacterized protein n=1 Tax=Corchorus olitorius TaxID=93759 RepID=A0A1R3J5D9_9ROSI|nr:hypothetical protein COLO4_19440 [Corchorus olitorius]